MIRFFVLLLLAIAFIWFGTTVRMGNRTLFGHVRAVWATDEAQDMKKGVEESTKPVIEKVKRGVEAGYREATRDAAPDDSAGHRSDPPVDADPPIDAGKRASKRPRAGKTEP